MLCVVMVNEKFNINGYGAESKNTCVAYGSW